MAKHILIVEDEPDSAKILEMLLELHGYTSAHAINAKEALKYIKEHAFDALIIDLFLPETDGFQLLKSIRNDNNMMDVPALAITAYNFSEVRKKANAAGFDRFHAKPLDHHYLMNDLNELLR